MIKTAKRIAITGGAGQIAYNLLFRIASGEMFGHDQPISLHILELPEALQALEGVKMELEDCAFPLLIEIKIGSDPRHIFEGVDYALLIGATPRGPGMERKDLLEANGKIFITQGRILNQVANKNVKVLVIGNPCNTNCLIALQNAPSLLKQNFYAMTMLDHNRAISLLAQKARVAVTDVSNMTIWGNHSSTQVPDFLNAQIHHQPVLHTIKDREWLEKIFLENVQKRGAAIISARGKSSAASAANAIIDHIRALIKPTPKNDWFSCSILSDENPYGISPGLIFSFPCRTLENGSLTIVKNIHWDAFLKEKIKNSENELIEERKCVT